MFVIKRLEDIEAWQKARELARAIYRATPLIQGYCPKTSGSAINRVKLLSR